MAKEEERGLIKYESRGQEVILSAAIVRDLLVTGKKELVSNQEITYFLAQCQARQMNPFVKDCYLVKFDTNPAAIIVAIDFYRSRARSAPDCTGWEAGVICLDKKSGGLRYSNGLVLPHEELVGGWFKARPTGWIVDCLLEVNLSGYAKDNAFWKGGKAATMIAKVAESQGLRRVWPDLFQGTYTAEERNFDLDQLDAGTPPAPGSQGDITPKSESGPKLDTSVFDKAVKKLKWDKEQMRQMDEWLAITANKSCEPNKVVTADMVKLTCVKRFELFLAKFKEWQEVNYPAPPETPPGPTTTTQPGEEAGATTGKSPVEEPGGEGSEPPPDLAGGIERTIEDRRDAVWDQVINKNIPLAALAVLDPPVSAPGHITEENIAEAEELVATYQAPTGRGKK